MNEDLKRLLKQIIRTLTSFQFYKLIFATIPRLILREGYRNVITTLSETFPRVKEEYNFFDYNPFLFSKPSYSELVKSQNAVENFILMPLFSIIFSDEPSEQTRRSLKKQIYTHFVIGEDERADWQIELAPNDLMERNALFECALALNIEQINGNKPEVITFGWRDLDNSNFTFYPAKARFISLNGGKGVYHIKKILISSASEKPLPLDFTFPVGSYMFGTPYLSNKLINKILLCKIDVIGDAMWVIPSVRKVRDLFPDSIIDMLCSPATFDFWQLVPEINSVISTNASVYNANDFTKQKFLNVKTTIATNDYDLIIVLHTQPAPINNYLPNLIENMADFRLGYLSDKLFTHTLPLRNDSSAIDNNLNSTEQYLHLLAAIDLDKQYCQPIDATIETIAKIDRFCSEHSIFNSKLVVAVGLGAGMSHREYPLSKFTSFLDMIITKFEAGIILFGGGNDSDKCDEVKRLSKCSDKIVNIVGCHSLHETLELMKRVDVFVGNDSGGGHMAAIQGVPVLTIWPNWDLVTRCAPKGKYSVQVIYPNSNMFNSVISDSAKILNEIEPEHVFEGFERLLVISGLAKRFMEAGEK